MKNKTDGVPTMTPKETPADKFVHQFATNLTNIAEDWSSRDREFDKQDVYVQMSRAIRDNLHEVWEWLALEGEVERLRAENRKLKHLYHIGDKKPIPFTEVTGVANESDHVTI